MNFYNPIHFFKNAKYYMSGLLCLRTLKYLEAISFLEKGLTHAQKNRFPVYELTKYLGIAYCRDKQFQKGKHCLLEAEKLLNQVPEKRVDSELFYYLGIIYDTEAICDTKENLKKAKEYYQLAIKYYKRTDELTEIDFISSRLIKIDEWFK